MTEQDFDSVFLTSVQTAVGSSVGGNKPLVVYIASSSNDATWINSLLRPETLKLISDFAVGLQLVKGSTECQLFEQVFPNVQAPSVFIVRVRAVLDVIYGDVSIEEFEQRVRKAIETEQPPAVPLDQQPQTAHGQQPPESPVHSQQSRPSAQPREHKSLKEQTAEMAAKRYREEQLRLKQVQREERERIRRLLKADEEERKALERERRLSSKGHSDDLEAEATKTELRDNIKHKSNEETCALSLRLLDGHSLQHIFQSNESLGDVRKWIDENRTDGATPYCFHRTIPRMTYEATDEEKSLQSLELTPRSALILQPFHSYSEAYNSASQNGLFSRIWGGFSTFWGSKNNQQGHNPAQGHSTAAPREPTGQSSSYEPFRDEAPDLARSPQSSYYASPMHSPQPPLAFEMSHPSALNLNLNLNENADHPQRSRTPNADVPIPPATLSRMSSNIRTFDSPRADDERVTYNGNRVNLEDDNSKAPKN